MLYVCVLYVCDWLYSLRLSRRLLRAYVPLRSAALVLTMASPVGTVASLFPMFDSKDPKKSCEEKVRRSLERCGKVRFLVEALEKMGCPLPKDYIQCAECSDENGACRGGFGPFGENGQTGIVICQNSININEGEGGAGQTAVDVTLAHELIHAFDHARAKVDWTSARHHACSEIRAASLSGDCDFKREWDRFGGFRDIRARHQECVKRRATLSVSGNPNCTVDEAKAAVEATFEACYADTAPFDKNP
jgi:mitochondrial inner membrane protease ATP23